VLKVDSAIGRLIQQEVDKEVENRVKKERIEKAKRLLKYLNVEIIAKEFDMTLEEIEDLKNNSSDTPVPQS